MIIDTTGQLSLINIALGSFFFFYKIAFNCYFTIKTYNSKFLVSIPTTILL